MDEQRVVANTGVAYGVMHADLHVRGDAKPPYRLSEADLRAGATPIRPRWPGTRLAALWLHGPSFTRTSEAAESIAAGLAAEGWAVLEATIQEPLPGPQPELVPAGSPGVVILVPGADRWSTPELAWMLSNAVVHRPELPARILTTAGTMGGLPALRSILARSQSDIEPLAVP